MLPITGNELSMDEKRTPVYGIDWRPQLSLMSQYQLRQYCNSGSPPRHDSAPSHIKKYVFWLKKQLQATQPIKKHEIAPLDLEKEFSDLLEERPSWKVFFEVAQNLCPLVRGEMDSADLLVSGMLIPNFLSDVSGSSWDRKLSAFLNLAAHQTPNLKILSVGSATCGINSHVFSALQQIERDTGGIAFSKLVLMDEMPSSLNQQELLQGGEDRITFIANQVIEAQGFKPREFDLIIVNNVLSDATSQTAALKSLRAVLRFGGHLVIQDLVTPDRLSTTFGIGALPGWWSNKTRPLDTFPKVSESIWDSTLKECGYSGNDLVLRDSEDDAAHHTSIIVSKAEEPTNGTANGPRASLVVNEHELQNDVVAALDDSFLCSLGYRPQVFSIAQLADAKASLDSNVVIWLADIDRPLLAELSVSSFDLIKGWIKQAKNLLWVTSTETTRDIDSALYPHSGLKDGFLRSIRLEFNDKRIISLSIETGGRDVGFYAGCIFKTFVSAFQASTHLPEVEYIVRDGLTLTGRLVVDADLNMHRTPSLAPQINTEPWDLGPPLKLDVANRGSLDTLRSIEDHDNYKPLGPTEVEISARGWGVNFRDVFIALGRLEENDFGTDCAGVVTRLAVARIPDSISFETACAIIGPAITAWYSLIEVGRLQKNEKVLIHAASGATGQLAIQVAKMVGAEIFATVGFNHKKQLLKDTYGIPDDHILFSRNTSFARGVMRMTNGIGVDVVLNSLVGNSLRASWECIAPYGRFVEIGKADIYADTSLPMGCFAKNVSFSAVDLRHIMLSRPDTARKLLLKAMELAQNRSVYSPEPLHLYDVCAVEDAFRYFQSGKNTGRTVIKIDGDVHVQKHVIHRRTWSFDIKATYMVVGGLGGVGRLLLKWMVSRGAKYLIVPSRSGIASQTAAKLVDELAQQGIIIAAPLCDVSSEESFSKMLAQYSSIFPPIRGCINAAMALHDSTFDKMRYAQWEGTVRSKAQTSWVLSNLLPKDLEFFISLASTTGVFGNVGAPNYAAGCTFQDSLAEYRARRYSGKSLSIDLGVMSKVGVVAETASLQRVFSKFHGHAQVDDDDLLALLDVCCDPAYDLSRSQVVMGFSTPAELVSRGHEVMEALKQPLLAHFSQSRSLSTDARHPGSRMSPRAIFQKAETDEERRAIVVQCMTQKVARALSIEPDEVEIDKPLHVFGVDSLVAVELRNWMRNEFAAHIPVFEITGGKTIELIGELVCKASEIRKVA
ncbi:KR-domain-containing protein [Hypoxylon sp. NC1633]|nr:KR-domain-containing protein [Hypoxylon sp. NC1633]